MIIYNWRCETGNNTVNGIIDDILTFLYPESILIPPEERIHFDDTSISEELKHDYMRMNVYNFLHGDENDIDKFWRSYESNLTFAFYLTDQGHKFITSEQPSMLIDGHDGKLEHILVATPTLLISTTKKYNKNLSDNKC